MTLSFIILTQHRNYKHCNTVVNLYLITHNWRSEKNLALVLDLFILFLRNFVQIFDPKNSLNVLLQITALYLSLSFFFKYHHLVRLVRQCCFFTCKNVNSRSSGKFNIILNFLLSVCVFSRKSESGKVNSEQVFLFKE